MGDPTGWVSAIAAAFSAGAAGMAAWAAVSSKSATCKLAGIESARRHQELTPQIAANLVPLNPGAAWYSLTIELQGPLALQKVAGLSVRVRDDRPDRDREPVSFQGNIATAAQLTEQIWGPLRLTPNLLHGSGKVDQTGRFIDIRDALPVGESVRLQMEPTPLPPWCGSDRSAAESWWQDTVGTLVRIVVELFPTQPVGAEGKVDAWIVPIDIPMDHAEHATS